MAKKGGISGGSYACNYIYGPACTSCDIAYCYSCSGLYVLFRGLCTCTDTRILNSNGDCVLCSSLFRGCRECYVLTSCSRCSHNYTNSIDPYDKNCKCDTYFTMTGNICTCETPNVFYYGVVCIPCSRFFDNCINCLWYSKICTLC